MTTETRNIPSLEKPAPSISRPLIAAVLLTLLLLFPASRLPTVIILSLLLLITAHELGHLWAARSVGVGASEFAVGFGPRLWSLRTRRMLWSFRAIPLGGFVRIKGMESNEPGADPQAVVPGLAYRDVATWKQVFISAAGPFANFIAAALIIFIGFFTLGVPSVAESTQISITPNSPAAAAGLSGNVTVLEVEGQSVATWSEIRDKISSTLEAEEEVDLLVSTASGVELFSLAPQSGYIGVQSEVLLARADISGSYEATSNWISTIASATKTALSSAGSAIAEIPDHFAGTSESPDERFVSPVGVASIASDVSTSVGSLGVFLLIAQFSFFLGVFNLLPFPPLDGGHILISCVNRVGRFFKPAFQVPQRLVAATAATFTLLLLVLGVATILLDIFRPISLSM